MIGVRLGATALAAAIGIALAALLPALFGWLFGLEAAQASVVWRSWLWLAPAVALSVGAVAATTLRVPARDFRGEAPAAERTAARAEAHRFPGRVCAAFLGGGSLATLALAAREIALHLAPAPRASAMALATLAAVTLGALALYVYARSALGPRLAHLPELPLDEHSRFGLRGIITLGLIGLALAALLPAPLLLRARLDTVARAGRRARAEQAALAIRRVTEGLDAASARALVDGAPLVDGLASLRSEAGTLAPPERAARLGRRPFVEQPLGGTLAAGAVRVAFAPPSPDPGLLALVFVALLLSLAVIAASTIASVFAGDVEALTPQVSALVSSDGARLDALGGVEVARVGAAVNALLDRVARHHVDSFLAVEKLEEARRMKSQFLANMSHDLRSPLNSILGFSELLVRGLDGEVGPEEHAHLLEIQRDGKRLLRLINEILDTAKCESGRMVPHPQAVTAVEVLTQAVQELRRIADPPPDVELATEIQPGLEPVQVDPILLPQAVAHLMAYALGAAEKGRRPGEVRVAIAERRVGKARRLAVEVSASGAPPPGDSDAERERLFVGFRRVGPGDLGLTLPLARRLVELHGGTLSFGDGAQLKLVLSVPVAPPRERLGVLRRKTVPPTKQTA